MTATLTSKVVWYTLSLVIRLFDSVGVSVRHYWRLIYYSVLLIVWKYGIKVSVC